MLDVSGWSGGSIRDVRRIFITSMMGSSADMDDEGLIAAFSHTDLKTTMTIT